MDPLEIKRNGYSLADCAEIMNRMSVLKTEHGEPGYRSHFQQFLRSKGLTENAWAGVWNDWHQTMENDPQLAAKFHTYLGQVRQRQMMANQPNVAGESMEGVSLESFAKISAQIQTGAAVEGLVAGEGLTMDQWQRGQAAWGQRMGSISPTDPIMIQFGQLYQKWSPNHQAMMEAATARHLEDASNREGRGGGMAKALDMSNAAEFFDHADVRIRARGVREMIRVWDLGSQNRDARMRALTQRAYDEAIKILTHGAGDDRPGIMALDRPADAMEIHAWSAIADQEEAQQGTTDLVIRPIKDLAAEKFMTPQQDQQARAALGHAIARLQPRAQRVEQAFASVKDELKRTQLRQLIDDYRSTLSDLQEAIDDWEYNGPEDAVAVVAARPSFGASSSAPASTVAVVPAPATGFLAMLKSLPIIGPLLRMLGL